MMFFPTLEKFLEEKTGLSHWNSSRSELICRCPFPDCELDSFRQKEVVRDHGHLYISTKEPVFFCQKCNTSGSIIKLIRKCKGDPKKFLPAEVLDGKTFEFKYKKFEQFGIYKHFIPKINPDIYKLKRQYLKYRLGQEIDLEKIPGLVLNIREFITENKIQLTGNSLRLFEYFENSFVGFITSRGTKLVLRNIDDNADIQYHKINLIEEGGFFKDIYGVHLRYPLKDINTIVLCEGVFDLLVALNHPKLREIKEKSCYWAAVIGTYYNKAILSVLDLCNITMSDVVILSDSNVPEKNYYWVSKNISVRSLSVYYNKLGEDFGKLPISLVKAKEENIRRPYDNNPTQNTKRIHSNENRRF